MRNTKPVVLMVALVAAFAMSGCGKKNNNPGGVPLPGQPGYPQYPQGNFPGGVGGQCAPISGPIPFSGAFYVNSASIVSSQTGAVPIQPMPTNQYNPYGQQGMLQLSGSGSDAWMTLQVQMMSTNQGSGGGQMQLSSLFVQSLMYKIQTGQIPMAGMPGMTGMPGMNPYNPYQPQMNPAAICASIVKIDLGHYATTLYGGQVQIMLNNSVPLIVKF